MGWRIGIEFRLGVAVFFCHAVVVAFSKIEAASRSSDRPGMLRRQLKQGRLTFLLLYWQRSSRQAREGSDSDRHPRISWKRLRKPKDDLEAS